MISYLTCVHIHIYIRIYLTRYLQIILYFKLRAIAIGFSNGGCYSCLRAFFALSLQKFLVTNGWKLLEGNLDRTLSPSNISTFQIYDRIVFEYYKMF